MTGATASVDQELEMLRRRVDSLERTVSSLPPAHDMPAGASTSKPTTTKRGWRSLFDEKVLITAIVSLVGVWATIYTNDRGLEQEVVSMNQQLELETVKYQLGQYLSADDLEERVTVLRIIQDMPHTNNQMRKWAKEQFTSASSALVEARKLTQTEATAAELKVEKIERGEEGELDDAEKQQAEKAGERVAVAVRKQIEQGTIKQATPAATPSPRERARALWSQGYEEYKKTNYERAAELYESSLAADRAYAPAQNSLGNIAYQRGDLKSAEKAFRKATELDQDYAPAAYNLALVLNAQARAEDAALQLKEAVRVNPKYALRDKVESTLSRPSPAPSRLMLE